MLALLMNWQRKHSIVFKNEGFFQLLSIYFSPFFRVFNSVCLLEGSHCYYPWPDQKWLRVNFHMHKLSNAEELDTDLLLTKQRLQSHRWSVIKYNQRRVIKCHCHLLHIHKWNGGTKMRALICTKSREAGRDLSLSLIILIERGYLVTSQHKSLDAIFVNGGQTDDSTTGPISADGEADT